MMLTAYTLGIACYIGQDWPAFAEHYGQKLLRQWNIPTDHYAVIQLLLGYPRGGTSTPPRSGEKLGVLYELDEKTNERKCNTGFATEPVCRLG